ncbi:MAG: hypothetical protein ACTSSP_12610 [Candidatus Asgardarchaeia archaeon]
MAISININNFLDNSSSISIKKVSIRSNIKCIVIRDNIMPIVSIIHLGEKEITINNNLLAEEENFVDWIKDETKNSTILVDVNLNAKNLINLHLKIYRS